MVFKWSPEYPQMPPNTPKHPQIFPNTSFCFPGVFRFCLLLLLLPPLLPLLLLELRILQLLLLQQLQQLPLLLPLLLPPPAADLGGDRRFLTRPWGLAADLSLGNDRCHVLKAGAVSS